MNTSEYWVGPYGVLVPKNVKSVVARDGGNTLYQDGCVTEMGIIHAKPFGEKEYKDQYATYNPNDNNWYYTKNK